MQKDFNDQRLMGVPANPPSTLFLEGDELAAALRQRKILFLDQLGTSPLSVGLFGPQNLEGSAAHNIESRHSPGARPRPCARSTFMLSVQPGRFVSITGI